MKNRCFALLLLLVGCTPLLPSGNPTPEREPLACNQIFDEALLTINYDDVPESEIVQWVSDHYGDVNIVPEAHQNGTRYRWMWEGQLYRARYANESERLVGVEVEFTPQPTLGEVERCFGKPQFYEVNFYRRDVPVSEVPFWSTKEYDSNFTLFYPGAGVRFFDYREGNGHTVPPIDENTLVKYGTVLRKGTLDTMLDDMESDSIEGLMKIEPYLFESWNDLHY